MGVAHDRANTVRNWPFFSSVWSAAISCWNNAQALNIGSRWSELLINQEWSLQLVVAQNGECLKNGKVFVFCAKCPLFSNPVTYNTLHKRKYLENNTDLHTPLCFTPRLIWSLLCHETHDHTEASSAKSGIFSIYMYFFLFPTENSILQVLHTVLLVSI